MSYSASRCMTALAVLLTLAFAMPLQAQEKCTNKSLQGAFGFGDSGTDLTLNVPVGMSGRLTADGSGHLAGTVLRSIGGNLAESTFSGSYRVAADCTAAASLTLADHSTMSLRFVLQNGGHELSILRTDQGIIEVGNGVRQLKSPHGDVSCNDTSLEGAIGFGDSGTNLNLGGLISMSGVFVSDGKGKFQGSAVQSVTGLLFERQFDGTYAVNADCTGSAVFNLLPDNIKFDLRFVLVDDGNQLFIMGSDPGVVQVGMAKKTTSHAHERG